MEGWVRDLVIAVAGALIGAVLLYLFSIGFQWTAKSRGIRRRQRDSDIVDWKSGDAVKRQRIFNAYLFSVLKFFIIGNILIGVATAFSDLEPNEPGISNFDYITALMDAVGVVFYVATLGEILRFTKLIRSESA